MDRSGLTGWMFDANNTAEKLFEGHVGLSALAGGAPMEPLRLAQQARSGSGADGRHGVGRIQRGVRRHRRRYAQNPDTRALFRIMPLGNVFYLRRAIFDPAEEGINAYLGIRR